MTLSQRRLVHRRTARSRLLSVSGRRSERWRERRLQSRRRRRDARDTRPAPFKRDNRSPTSSGDRGQSGLSCLSVCLPLDTRPLFLPQQRTHTSQAGLVTPVTHAYMCAPTKGSEDHFSWQTPLSLSVCVFMDHSLVSRRPYHSCCVSLALSEGR